MLNYYILHLGARTRGMESKRGFTSPRKKIEKEGERRH